MGLKLSSKKQFAIIIFLQVLFLIMMITTKMFTLETGQSIFLKTIPVDPRSLFRGDYVILNYEISNIPLKEVSTDIKWQQLKNEENNGPGSRRRFYNNYALRKELRRVYVKLKKETPTGAWQVVSATLAKPQVAAGEVMLIGKNGRIETFYLPGKENRAILTLHLDYGIESYFIPEGKGKIFEKYLYSNMSMETKVEVAVDRFGGLGILGVYVADQKLEH